MYFPEEVWQEMLQNCTIKQRIRLRLVCAEFDHVELSYKQAKQCLYEAAHHQSPELILWLCSYVKCDRQRLLFHVFLIALNEPLYMNIPDCVLLIQFLQKEKITFFPARFKKWLRETYHWKERKKGMFPYVFNFLKLYPEFEAWWDLHKEPLFEDCVKHNNLAAIKYVFPQVKWDSSYVPLMYTCLGNELKREAIVRWKLKHFIFTATEGREIVQDPDDDPLVFSIGLPFVPHRVTSTQYTTGVKQAVRLSLFKSLKWYYQNSWYDRHDRHFPWTFELSLAWTYAAGRGNLKMLLWLDSLGLQLKPNFYQAIKKAAHGGLCEVLDYACERVGDDRLCFVKNIHQIISNVKHNFRRGKDEEGVLKVFKKHGMA